MANTGLILPTTLALQLGLGELVEHHFDLGDAPGWANVIDGLMAVVATVLPAATASTTPMRCVPATPSGCWAAWSRHRPPWAPSCTASAGGTCASGTRPAGRCWLGPETPGRDPATGRRPSTWTPPSARPTACPRGAPGAMATLASSAITRCWPWLPAPARC